MAFIHSMARIGVPGSIWRTEAWIMCYSVLGEKSAHKGETRCMTSRISGICGQVSCGTSSKDGWHTMADILQWDGKRVGLATKSSHCPWLPAQRHPHIMEIKLSRHPSATSSSAFQRRSEHAATRICGSLSQQPEGEILVITMLYALVSSQSAVDKLGKDIILLLETQHLGCRMMPSLTIHVTGRWGRCRSWV